MRARLGQPLPLPPQFQLGILIQWQQAYDAEYWPLERELRRDLLRMGFDVLQLPPTALQQLGRLAHLSGFTGAIYSDDGGFDGVWAHFRERSSPHPQSLRPRSVSAARCRPGEGMPGSRTFRGLPYGPSPFCLWSQKVDRATPSVQVPRRDAAQSVTILYPQGVGPRRFARSTLLPACGTVAPFSPHEVGTCMDGRLCVRPAAPGPYLLLAPGLPC